MPNLVIDVETTGPCPELAHMIQIGVVDLDGPEFFAKFSPPKGTGNKYPEALQAIGITWEEIRTWPYIGTEIVRFYDWLEDTYKGKRVVTWSDNPAFDWQFVNHALWNYCGENPLGFSMRRIGDFYAGVVGDVTKASKWKSLRDTKHTHNALDDARGNAEALRKIMKMGKKK